MTTIHSIQLQLPIKLVKTPTVVPCELFMLLGHFYKYHHYFFECLRYAHHIQIKCMLSKGSLAFCMMDEESEA